MNQRVVVLGACCAGKSSLRSELELRRHPAIECDEEVLRSAGGVWPATEDANRRLVIEAAVDALAMPAVIFLTSWVPTTMLVAARSRGFTVALLSVPLPELHRRNTQRLALGGSSDVSHWFEQQLANYDDLAAAGVIDTTLDGTQSLAALAEQITRPPSW